MFSHLQAAAVSSFTLTPGRIVGTIAALIALAGVIIGGVVLARRRTGRRAPVIAVSTGVVGIVGGGLIVALAEGGPGTGYGIVGGFFALALGVAAIALGWLALARARRPVATR